MIELELTEIEERFEVRSPFLLRSIVEHRHDDERLHNVKLQVPKFASWGKYVRRQEHQAQGRQWPK